MCKSGCTCESCTNKQQQIKADIKDDIKDELTKKEREELRRKNEQAS